MLGCTMKKKITKRTVDALKPGDSLADTEIVGFTKPFELTEMKEALAHMLGLPQGWSQPEPLQSSVRH